MEQLQITPNFVVDLALLKLRAEARNIQNKHGSKSAIHLRVKFHLGKELVRRCIAKFVEHWYIKEKRVLLYVLNYFKVKQEQTIFVKEETLEKISHFVENLNSKRHLNSS